MNLEYDSLAAVCIWTAACLAGCSFSATRQQLIATLLFYECNALTIAAIRIFS